MLESIIICRRRLQQRTPLLRYLQLPPRRLQLLLLRLQLLLRSHGNNLALHRLQGLRALKSWILVAGSG